MAGESGGSARSGSSNTGGQIRRFARFLRFPGIPRPAARVRPRPRRDWDLRPPRPGPTSHRSRRVCGARGAGYGSPDGPAPRVASDASGGPAERRGGRGRRPSRGRVGTWKTGTLRTCGPAARGRFPDFQDFRSSPLASQLLGGRDVCHVSRSPELGSRTNVVEDPLNDSEVQKLLSFAPTCPGRTILPEGVGAHDWTRMKQRKQDRPGPRCNRYSDQ